MDIKKLQNNYTTPEQSKRLLELGVPVDSSDCIFTRFSRDEKWKRRFIEDIVSIQLSCNQDFYLPCWSVGRLIEIRDICAKYYITHDDFKGNYIENIIMSFYAIHATNGFDFSKLEE